MPSLRALMIVATVAAPAAAQVDRPPPPPAVLGEPIGTPPFLDPLVDPLLRRLGPPDEPFRPFAPLGPPPAIACEGIGSRFGMGLLAGRYGMPGYGLTWIPTQPVAGQPTNLSVLRQELSLFAPIHREGQDTAAIGLGIRNSMFFTDAVLPTSGRPFPDMLWDIEAGMAYSHLWDNGWTTGVVVSAGSASDEPFAQSNVLVASLALYAAIPAGEQEAWILGVSYSPTSDFPYPLPIVSYYWRPSDDVELNIGFPFFAKWRFAPDLTAEVLWVPIRTVSARVTWQAADLPGFRAYGAFDWANESWFLADRTNDSDRFYAFEKRLTAGMQFDLVYRLRLDLSVGYVFDRFYFQGKQYTDRNQDRVNVGGGIFGAIQLRLQF
jgi:hypothetical protein